VTRYYFVTRTTYTRVRRFSQQAVPIGKPRRRYRRDCPAPSHRYSGRPGPHVARARARVSSPSPRATAHGRIASSLSDTTDGDGGRGSNLRRAFAARYRYANVQLALLRVRARWFRVYQSSVPA